MFYNQSEYDGVGWSGLSGISGFDEMASRADRATQAAPGNRGTAPESMGALDPGEEVEGEGCVSTTLLHSGYERELIQSVWEFAEVVSGNDPELWRKDEFGDWIYRFDYGRRMSEFGWEIFDPGIGRHAQGVYAMRPMQWQSYIRQYESFS